MLALAPAGGYGRRAASGSADRDVRIWDVIAGVCVCEREREREREEERERKRERGREKDIDREDKGRET